MNQKLAAYLTFDGTKIAQDFTFTPPDRVDAMLQRHQMDAQERSDRWWAKNDKFKRDFDKRNPNLHPSYAEQDAKMSLMPPPRAAPVRVPATPPARGVTPVPPAPLPSGGRGPVLPPSPKR